MSVCVVTITDAEELARVVDSYLRCLFGSEVESYFMTYSRSLLSGSLLRKTDLFILELLRRDDLGYRAEALFAAEKWAPLGKRVLVVSGGTSSGDVGSPAYWDMAASDTLCERIRNCLHAPPASAQDIQRMRTRFVAWCRPAADHHGR